MLYGTPEVSIDSLFLLGGDLDRKYPRASPLVAKAVRGPFLISDDLVSFFHLFWCYFHLISMSLPSPGQFALPLAVDGCSPFSVLSSLLLTEGRIV